jgi:hypothetical protein
VPAAGAEVAGSPFTTPRWLRIYNLATGIINAAVGIGFIFLARDDIGDRSIFTSFLTSDRLRSKAAGHPVYAEASQRLFDFNLGHLMAAILLAAAIMNILRATVWRNRYERQVENGGFAGLRWLDTALLLPALVTLAAVASGVQEFTTLMLVAGMTLLAVLLGYAFDRYGAGVVLPRRLAIGLFILAAFPLLAVFKYVKDAMWFGTGLPGYAYWIDGAVLLFAAAAASIWVWSRRRVGLYASGRTTELNLLTIGFLAVSLVAAQVYGGIFR